MFVGRVPVRKWVSTSDKACACTAVLANARPRLSFRSNATAARHAQVSFAGAFR